MRRVRLELQSGCIAIRKEWIRNVTVLSKSCFRALIGIDIRIISILKNGTSHAKRSVFYGNRSSNRGPDSNLPDGAPIRYEGYVRAIRAGWGSRNYATVPR